jgi:CcmD family protein
LKNFDNLFAAWMVVWVVFFVFEVSVARRMARLREEVDRLKRQLREG